MEAISNSEKVYNTEKYICKTINVFCALMSRFDISFLNTRHTWFGRVNTISTDIYFAPKKCRAYQNIILGAYTLIIPYVSYFSSVFEKTKPFRALSKV